MDAARLIIPAALALAMASAFFGVVLARVIWADEARRGDRQVQFAQEMTEKYKDVYKTMSQTIEMQRQHIHELERSKP